MGDTKYCGRGNHEFGEGVVVKGDNYNMRMKSTCKKCGIGITYWVGVK